MKQTSALVLLVAALASAAGCLSDTKGVVPTGTLEPDKFLFDKGTTALTAKKWLTAREYFKQVVETYTGSVYRPDAKLGVGSVSSPVSLEAPLPSPRSANACHSAVSSAPPKRNFIR